MVRTITLGAKTKALKGHSGIHKLVGKSYWIFLTKLATLLTIAKSVMLSHFPQGNGLSSAMFLATIRRGERAAVLVLFIYRNTSSYVHSTRIFSYPKGVNFHNREGGPCGVSARTRLLLTAEHPTAGSYGVVVAWGAKPVMFSDIVRLIYCMKYHM